MLGYDYVLTLESTFMHYRVALLMVLVLAAPILLQPVSETLVEAHAVQHVSLDEPLLGTFDTQPPSPELSVGYASCAVHDGGQISCWGENSEGQQGTGATSNSVTYPTLTSSLGAGRTATTVSTHDFHTCAVLDNQELRCWGRGDMYRLGTGSEQDQYLPAPIPLGDGLGAVDVAVGTQHTCAINTQGGVQCWGAGGSGQIGWGSNNPNPNPVNGHTNSLGANLTAVQIEVGYEFACVLLSDGSVKCWGLGSEGRLGSGNNNRNVPSDVPSFSHNRTATQISIGHSTTCALMNDGSVVCWGRNTFGQVGDGTTTTRFGPTNVTAFSGNRYAVQVGAGWSHSCAVLNDGSVACWGSNYDGQLGDGTNTDSLVPVGVESLGFNRKAVSVHAGPGNTCAVLDDASVVCWGRNTAGNHGDGTFTAKNVPGNYSQRALHPPVHEWAIEQQASSVRLDGTILEDFNRTNLAVNIETPSGMTFDATTFTISGVPEYSVQSSWNITLNDGSKSISGHYNLRILADTDYDGTPNIEDLDDDGDGTPDVLDACPTQSGTSSTDALGCPDRDKDGTSDSGDAFPMDASQQTDMDQDGFGDNTSGNLSDACPASYGSSTRNNEFGCPDADGDGWADRSDAFPGDLSQWKDSDGDGYGDSIIGFQGDACPNVHGNSTLDRLGCPDEDKDGWSDAGDAFPTDSTQWSDLDADGFGDNQSGNLPDVFPSDATQWRDSDGDGYGDNSQGNNGDAFPDNIDEWADTDSDGVGNNADQFPFDPSQHIDSDGDGFGDDPRGSGADRFPSDSTQWSDIDGDGYGDNAEGTEPDAFIADPTQWSDSDGDGYGDNPTGRQADLFPDDPTQWEDQDEDGFGDNQSGNNPDPYLFDFDNDGYNDSIDPFPKLPSPGDQDNDGTPDEEDEFPDDFREWADSDGDGEGDNADPDDDNDGWADTEEIRQGTDPYSSSSQPVDTFEIVIPGTQVGLGAWDLIGMFGGIPLFFWITFGFVTRNARTARFEDELRAAQSRDELEKVALRWEFMLMLRMLGPHQGIRLERLRAELDDRFESIGQSLAVLDVHEADQTFMVVQNMAAEDASSVESTSKEVIEIPKDAKPRAPSIDQQPEKIADGYEWIHVDGVDYYRAEGQHDDWTQWG